MNNKKQFRLVLRSVCGLFLLFAMLNGISTSNAQSAVTLTVAGESGGSGGDEVPFNYIKGTKIGELRIRHGQWIDSIEVVYVWERENGRGCRADPTLPTHKIGGNGGELSVYPLACDEYITQVFGNYGDYIDSFGIVTNKTRGTKKWGGTGGAAQYYYGTRDYNMYIQALRGRGSRYLDAIGADFYVAPQRGCCNIISGPSGGSGGKELQNSYPAGTKIGELRIRSGRWIDSIEVVYVWEEKNGQGCRSDQSLPTTKFGGNGGELSILSLDCDEYIKRISGKYDRYVDSIEVETSKGKIKRWGGNGGAADYQYKALVWQQRVQSLWGRGSQYVDAIGVEFMIPDKH